MAPLILFITGFIMWWYRKRKKLQAIALLLISLSYDFPLLLTAFVLFYPASGCFVSLSQATLIYLSERALD